MKKTQHRIPLFATRAHYLPLLPLLFAFATALSRADTPLASEASTQADTELAEKAYAIMAESERRDEGWIDNSADMEMIIRRADGREVVRNVRTKTLEGEDGRDKGLLLFDTPLDVRGTVFLTHSFPLESDHQWIYLPSQNRVKRISSKRQTGRFMGSEFTFEDMSAFSLEKNTYRYLGETECGEPLQACHIIETRSKDKYSGYEKAVSYIDKAELRSWKTELYSKRTGKHSKTITTQDYSQYLDRYWRPARLVMHNERNGASTELKWQNQTFKTGLKRDDFRKSALERRQ